MLLSKETLDPLTVEFKNPQELQSAYSQMLQHMINRALEGEMRAHLGHERHGRSSGNTRNGKGRKTVLSRKARCRSRRRGTVMGRSSRSWCKSGKYSLRGWRRRSWRCMRAG